MFNYFDLSVIPTFLSRFKVEKILAIGLSNELIMDEIISFLKDNNCFLYAIDPKLDVKDVVKEYDDIKDSIEYYSNDSLNVLPELKDIDAVFINGDPNWYTVYNELNLIKENNSKFPIVFVCNNKYPHKRRDSYTNPNKIPKEFKNECSNDLQIIYEENDETRCTMVKDGLCHAIQEDTPKNGVLTAIEDFLKENSSLEFLDINPLEGISLIYPYSEIAKLRVNQILENPTENAYTINDLSDKIIENDILLKHVSRINVLKDDIDKVEEFKSEIEDKDNQLKEYEDKIHIQNTQIEYNESKLNNIESQISLGETKILSAETKLINKDNEIKEIEMELSSKNDEIKDIERELSSKDDQIKDKEEELEFVNSQLLLKENELKTTKNRLINLENHFLDVKKELNFTKRQLSEFQSNIGTSDDKLADFEDNFLDNFTDIKKELVEVQKQLSEVTNASNEYKDNLISRDLEKEYLKNDAKLSKKIFSPLSYIYLVGKSKPNEIMTNIKLYRTLKNSECFDIGYYLNKYPDIPESNWCKYFSPQLHYVCNGFDEHRKFNDKDYNIKNKNELIRDIQKK